MKKLLLPFVLLVAFATPSLSAQITQVKKTGCPNAGYPTHNSTARIGQTLRFAWSCKQPDLSVALMGWASGRTIGFNQPFTCSKGPCGFYLAPFGASFYVFSITGSSGSWSIPIPNDRRLLFSTYGLQCLCLSVPKRCMDFSGALVFAIGP